MKLEAQHKEFFVGFGRCVCLAVLLGSALQGASVLAVEITRESFGLHLHGLKYGVRWPACSFGAIRLWDSGTQWRQIQPAPDQWDFTVLDDYVKQAEAEGVMPVLTLGQTPEWAAKDPSIKNGYGNGATSPPADIAHWREYVETLALRYDGRIRYWEIWNEANAPNFWNGSMRELVELERVASATLKNVNKKNKILSPSFQAGEFERFEEYLLEGGGVHSNVISFHFYALRYPPEKIAARIERVKEILKRHELADMPLWNTEIGWLLANRDGGFGNQIKPSWKKWKRVSWDDSPGVVLRALMLSFSGGLNHVFWYSWNARQMGLAENHGVDPKPAAQAYQAGFDWLVGTQMQSCEENAARWVCRVTAGNQSRYIVWATSPQQFTLPPEWAVNTLTNFMGESRAIPPGASLRIDGLPVLLSNGAVVTKSCMQQESEVGVRARRNTRPHARM